MPSAPMSCTNNSSLTSEPESIPTLEIEQVVQWLTEGHRSPDVREAIAQRFPGRDADELQTLAVEYFARAAHCDVDVVHGWAMEAYRDLYRRMIAIGDFAGAIRAVKELTTLVKHVHRHNEKNAEPGEDAENGDAAGQ